MNKTIKSPIKEIREDGTVLHEDGTVCEPVSYAGANLFIPCTKCCYNNRINCLRVPCDGVFFRVKSIQESKERLKKILSSEPFALIQTSTLARISGVNPNTLDACRRGRREFSDENYKKMSECVESIVNQFKEIEL